MFSNLRSTVRSLAKAPGFTIVAVVTLALGIGVNTSMFSVVDTLLFKLAPYPKADELVLLANVTRNGEGRTFSETELREIRAQVTELSSLLAYSHASFAMNDGVGPAERIHGICFSREMMETLRVQPIAGRAFLPDEFEPGKNQVLLISEAFWRGRFGGDLNVIGRTLRLNGEAVTVVGVMPERFNYMPLWGNVVAWRPLNLTPDQLRYRAYRSLFLVGRLAPGATPSSVAAQLAPLAATQEKANPQDYPGLRYRAILLHEAAMDGAGRSILWTMLGLAGFILLIACANLANLQLARSMTALRDFAIRAALGASRRQLIFHQLTEAVVLALAGGLLGLIVALWVNSFLERNILIEDARGISLPLDGTVLLVSLAASLATGVLFGLAPALFVSRTDVNSALKSQARGSTGGRADRRLRQALIVGEIGLALVLLAGAAVMNRGFAQMLRRNVGWDTAQVFTGAVVMPENRYDTPQKRIEFYRKLEAGVAAIPGIDHAALSTSVPLYSYTSDRQVFADGAAAGNPENPIASHVMITPDYFAAMGIPVREGRLFAPDLKIDGPQQIIVNQTLAEKFWPRESAVGKRLGLVDNSTGSNVVVWREVVGVVGDVESAANVTNPVTRLAVYRPINQEPWSFVNVVAHSNNPAGLVEPVRRVLTTIDPDLALEQAGSVRQFVDRTQHNFVIVSRLLIGFAVLGLVLAAVGLYGVISHLVAQRTLEFGIRLALGAPPAHVLRQVVGGGVVLAGIGIVIGLAGSVGLARVLGAAMPRVADHNAGAIAVAALLLFLVTVVACWLPARRAMKINPLEALRAD